MSRSASAKGKRRATDALMDDLEGDETSLSSPSTPLASTSQTRPVKKPKRAETRPCPICFEQIPLRLLAQHAELESERLQPILASIGDSSVYVDPHSHLNPLEEMPASRRRTVRQPAPKPSTSASKLPPTSVATSDPDPHTIKTLTTLKRRRKQRTQALRDIIDDTLPTHSRRRPRRRDGADEDGREGEECPVCMRMVWGDPDVVHAHVDACLAHNSMVATMTIRDPSASQSHSGSTPELDVDVEEDADENLDLGGPSTTDDLWEETITPEGHTGLRLRLGGVGSASRGAAQRLGFIVGSNRSEPLSRRGMGGVGDADGDIDLDVDVDVDGDDEGAFGTVQFGENDVIKLTVGRVGGQGGAGEEADVDVDGEGEVEVEAERPEQKPTPQQQMEMELSRAKIAGDAQATIRALESLIQLRTLSHPNPTSTPSTTLPSSTATNQFTCRICLDAYTEPTVSTGCWHVCCRECWLRCLGSTKLCPICMRITGVGELRRVYI